MNCEYCNKELKTKAGLTTHMKFCKLGSSVCEYCEKDFLLSANKKRHIDSKTCVKYIEHLEKESKNQTLKISRQEKMIVESKQKKENFKETLSQKDSQIKELQTRVEYLQSQCDQLLATTSTLAKKTGNVINKQQITQVNSNNNTLMPLTDDLIKKAVSQIDVHVHKSIDSMCDAFVKGIIETAWITDSSRNTLEVNLDGTIIKDYRGKKICEKIAGNEAMKLKRQEYIDTYSEKVNDYIADIKNTIHKANLEREKEKKKEQKKQRQGQREYRRQLKSAEECLYDSSSDSSPETEEQEEPVTGEGLRGCKASTEDFEQCGKIMVDATKLTRKDDLETKIPKRFNTKSN
jgi:hypothetical protein